MNQPLVSRYLLEKSFDDLIQEHGVNVRPSKDHTIFSLNYDQIDAKSGVRLVEECRGLILRPQKRVEIATWSQNPVGETDVVAWGMNRFYNLGEGHCAKLSDSAIQAFEKLDGTMILLYWNEMLQKWSCATRSVPEADLSIDGSNITFTDLFWIAVEHMSIKPRSDWFPVLDKTHTYVFELTSPRNQVVIYHPEFRVNLLARRCLQQGVELPVYDDLVPGVKVPTAWPLISISDLIKFVDEADPKKMEGAVLCDENFNRIKIKNKGYVFANKMKDSLSASPRNIGELILRKKADDVIPLLDVVLADNVQKTQAKIAEFFRRHDTLFHQARAATETRKDFALYLQNSGDRWLSGPMFSMWEQKCSSTSGYYDLLVTKDKLIPTAIDAVLEQL